MYHRSSLEQTDNRDNKMSIKKLVDTAAAGENAEFIQAFDKVIGEKISEALTDMKIEVGEGIMGLVSEESPVTGTRKVATFGDHPNRAEVRYNRDYEEYSVHHYKDGKHMGEGPVSYHGSDKDDAMNTAKHEADKRCSVKEEVEQITETFHVWDNGGETADRYTVAHHSDLKNPDHHGNVDMLGLSGHPTDPQGFSQWTTGKPGPHLGKKVKFEELPSHIQKHIKDRFSGTNEEIVSEGEERPYVCVHSKKGRHETTAKTSYEAVQKAAAKWGMKSTAGIDAHLADVKHTPVNEGHKHSHQVTYSEKGIPGHQYFHCTADDTDHAKEQCRDAYPEAKIHKVEKIISEVAAPGQEDWVKANKGRFEKEYGKKKGLRVLYARSWVNANKKMEEGHVREVPDKEYHVYVAKNKFSQPNKYEGDKWTFHSSHPSFKSAFEWADNHAEKNMHPVKIQNKKTDTPEHKDIEVHFDGDPYKV